MWTIVFICSMIYVEGASSLRLTRLDAPYALVRGDPVWLNCSFDLENDQLYSIKWYKNNVEFYRYLPGNDPPAQKYKLVGVYLSLDRSEEGRVYLYRTDLHSEGNYACEVSAEAPYFETVRQEKYVTIYVKPEKPPRIRGLSRRSVSEIDVTCIADASKPPSRLQWYINEREAQSHFVFPLQPRKHKSGLSSTQVSMKFTIQPVNYGDDVIKLVCLASFSQLYYVGSELMVISREPAETEVRSVPGYGRRGPTISKGKRSYDVGDTIELNCSSLVQPSPQLMWLINNVTVSSGYVIEYQLHERDPLTVLGLKFVLSPHHFIDNTVILNCTAQLIATVKFVNEKIAIADLPANSAFWFSENKRILEDNQTTKKYIVIIISFCLLIMRLQ